MSSSTKITSPHLSIGRTYAILGILSALIAVSSTLATAIKLGVSAIRVPSFGAESGIGPVIATLLAHRTAVLPVLLLTFAAGFLIRGFSISVSQLPKYSDSRGTDPGHSAGANKPLLLIGMLLVLIAFVMVAAMDLLFINPCESRTNLCWNVAPLLELPTLPHVWLPPLLALVGLIISVFAVPKTHR